MSGATVDGYRSRDVTERLRKKEIVTPEGVPLVFAVASPGDRVWGFFVDLSIIALLLLCVGLPLVIFGAAGAPFFALTLFLILFFLLRNFYFTFFEIRWQGSTPGKRRAKTRVIDRHGRPLSSGAVFVRNLTREVELFIPLVALSNPDAAIGGSSGLVQALACLWFLGMALMPLFNRDRLRVGDMVAGTLVVREPAAALRRDLVATRAPEAKYEFTPEELDVYGIYELQVLEDVLRRRGRASIKAKRVVTMKIIAKIGWQGDRRDLDPEAFLRDFYAAQRARLEQKMLFGERRERKQMPRGKKRG